MLKQGECEKCQDRGDYHGANCIVRKLIFNQERFLVTPSKQMAMEQAIRAAEIYESRRKKMAKEKNSLTTKTQDQNIQLATIEHVLIGGDLSKLNAEQRVMYLQKVCESLGLNPMTQPFSYIVLNGKLTLYAKKDATEQLRKVHDVSIVKLDRQVSEGVYTVTAHAKLPGGREDSSIGAVAIESLKGELKANAMMKAECVPLEYEILTKEGFKHPLEVETGEVVAAMDYETQLIHWTPLEQVSIFENQTVTKFGNSAVEFEFTQGHNWVTETFNGTKDLKPFDEIKSGTYLILAGENKDSSSLLNPKEAAALGWIITDGTIKTYKNEFYRASICQSKNENFEHIEWALSEYTPTRGLTDNRERTWMDQRWWYLSKKDTQTLFKKAGFTSLSDLPGIVSKLGYQARVSMLEAMMRADGDKRNNFGKSKPEVMEAFQILCALNGFLTSKVTTRLFDNSTKPFYLQRKLSYNKVAFQNLEEQESRIATVWCPTTQYGTWICRANTGQVFVTGNTKAKRRVTLSICGLGMLDETEVDSIPGAKIIDINQSRGQISEGPSLSKDQLGRLFAIAREANITSKDALKEWIGETFKKEPGFSLTTLSLDEYNAICAELQGLKAAEESTSSEPGTFAASQETLIAAYPPADVEDAAEAKEAAKVNANAVKDQDLPWNKYLAKK